MATFIGTKRLPQEMPLRHFDLDRPGISKNIQLRYNLPLLIIQISAVLVLAMKIHSNYLGFVMSIEANK